MKKRIHNNHLPPYCGECPYIKNESTDGYGYCAIIKREVYCSNMCWFTNELPSLRETVRLLHFMQKWRRGWKTKSLSPWLFGLAIDRSIKLLRKNLKK